MKKQILILTVFVLAIILSANKSFAQYQTVPTSPVCLTPTPLDPTCSTVDELHPAPGITYTYTVTSSAATNDIRWFVVNNMDLKDATTGGQVDSLINSIGTILPTTSSYIDPANASGDYILSLGTNNTYNTAPVSGDGTGTNHSIDIAWKFFNGLQPNEVLLVAYVADDAGCTDNIIVYRIIPEFNFTLDVAALNAAGDSVAGPGTANASDCVSPIESATYLSADDVVGNGTLTVDYGENWMFFVVNAANFVDSWLPSFQLTYSGQAGDLAEASWTYLDAGSNAAATWNAIDVTTGLTTVPVIAGGSTAAGVANNAVGDGATSAAGGECIVVRVRIDHGTDSENTTATQTLTLAVNGVMYDNNGTDVTNLYDDSAAYEDLHYGNCTIDGFTNDALTYDLTVRPEIDDSTPSPDEIKTGDE